VADLDDVEVAAEVGDRDEELAVGVEAQADAFLLFLRDVGKRVSLVIHNTLVYPRIIKARLSSCFYPILITA
jgi:hypothetical protein